MRVKHTEVNLPRLHTHQNKKLGDDLITNDPDATEVMDVDVKKGEKRFATLTKKRPPSPSLFFRGGKKDKHQCKEPPEQRLTAEQEQLPKESSEPPQLVTEADTVLSFQPIVVYQPPINRDTKARNILRVVLIGSDTDDALLSI